MPMYAAHMKHSPATCPLFNEQIMKRFKEAAERREEAATRNNVTVHISYTAPLRHVIYEVLEAPSHASVQSYLKEAGWAFFNDIDIHEVELVEELARRHGVEMKSPQPVG